MSIKENNISRYIFYTSIILILIGLSSRAAPLFNQDGRLLQQFVTEDGYLMLTVAHNMAIGNGMSTANGSITTNGIQPLFTFMQAAVFYLVGGDKTTGVLLVLIVSIGISLLSAFLLYRLTAYALSSRPYNKPLAMFTSSLWFASPIVTMHSMNCLESGLYVMLILLTVLSWLYYEVEESHSTFSNNSILIGLLLGLTFWSRIDVVFLIAAITLTHVFLGLYNDRDEIISRLKESIVIGCVAILIAAPWLIYNRLYFGSIMPVSGQTEGGSTPFGHNLIEVPSKLFEYIFILLPIPSTFEKSMPILIVSSFVILFFIGLVIYISKQMTQKEKALTYVVASFSIMLVFYYGLVFGAAHFVSRYFFPMSPFLAIFSVVMMFYLLQKAPFQKTIIPLFLILIITLASGLHLRIYQKGSSHEHFQVVHWVNSHVSDDTWVGAIQTGTLGFFHDRTVNLDGKVNPAALKEKRKRNIPSYIVNTSFDPQGNKIEYLADWQGIADWEDLPPLTENFQLIVNDKKNNLAVLKRKR